MRYFIGLLCVLLLTRCIPFDEEYSDRSTKKEQIVGAFSTPEGKFYLIGQEADYEVAQPNIAFVQWFLKASIYDPKPVYVLSFLEKNSGELYGVAWVEKSQLVPLPAGMDKSDISLSPIDCRDAPAELKNHQPDCLKDNFATWGYRFKAPFWAVTPVNLSNRSAILKTAKWQKPLPFELAVYTKKAETLPFLAGDTRTFLQAKPVSEVKWTPFHLK